MDQALSIDGQPIDSIALRSDREELIDQFNRAVGNPGEVIAALQMDFINGKMPYSDMVSYIRFCEYMIHAAQSREAHVNE